MKTEVESSLVKIGALVETQVFTIEINTQLILLVLLNKPLSFVLIQTVHEKRNKSGFLLTFFLD